MMSIVSTEHQAVEAMNLVVASWRYQRCTDEFSSFGWRQLGLREDPACYADWLKTIHEEDRDRVKAVIEAQLSDDGDQEFRLEYRLRPVQGSPSVISMHGYRYVARDESAQLVTTSIDLTPLRELSERLASQAERFQSVADTAPALIWVTDSDGRCAWFNQKWLWFTGNTMEAALIRGRFGNTHPDDQDTAIRTFQAAISQRDPIEVNYRLRNAHGEYRWILDRAYPSYDREGCFAGYVGTCIDVTQEREIAEQMALREDVMRQLHDLNEREKSFMACAIHDGLLQDIIGTDMLLQGLESFTPEKQKQRIELARKTIGAALSHGRRLISELRPMILDEQGLVSAIEFYAAELENRSQLSVTVNSELTRAVHAVGCNLWECNVFRIVQEALNNVESHSGVREASVHLGQRDDQLCVTIRDAGVGFDVEQARESFGILCMRERASIFGGIVKIESGAGVGTTVQVEVPLPDHLDRLSPVSLRQPCEDRS